MTKQTIKFTKQDIDRVHLYAHKYDVWAEIIL